MARFSVYRRLRGEGYLVDCQSDLLNFLKTRFVIPLLPVEATPTPVARLTPVFEIEGKSFVLATHLAAAVSTTDLRTRVTSLDGHDMTILNAIDMLISGY